MALSTTAIDTNRASTGVALPESVANKVIQGISENSAVMQLSQNLVIPGTGVTMDVITGDPSADWVGTETAEKAVSNPTLASKKMVPYTMAVIVPFSNQFKRDKAALYSAIVERIPNALAKKFDETVFFGQAPGANFDTLSAASAIDIEAAPYTGLVTAKTTISTNGGEANGWVFAPQAEAILLGALDANDRPIFIDSASNEGAVGRILGVPAFYRTAAYNAPATGANTLGFVGDWARAYTGIVNDVKIEISDQATINDGTNSINLWQRNMFAVRAEMEVGFIVEDDDYFARLTDTASA